MDGLVVSGFADPDGLYRVGADPLGDRLDHGHESGGQLCGRVLHSWWYLVVLGAADQAVALELSELSSQRGRGDGVKAVHKFVETGRAIRGQAAENPEFPSPTNHAGEIGHLTRGWVGGVVSHSPQLSLLVPL